MTKIKVYTKTGDFGQTSLANGLRCDKDDLRIASYGTVDELNSFVGLLLSKNLELESKVLLVGIQSVLFRVGAVLAGAKDEKKTFAIKKSDVLYLESSIDLLSIELSDLGGFVLPGGCETAGLLHVLRTVCRRLERLIVSLFRSESALEADTYILSWLNRLSDLFFVMARFENSRKKVSEPTWP